MYCVLDSAAAQHLEMYNDRKLLVSDYRRRISLSTEIFCMAVKFLTNLSTAHGFAYSRMFNWQDLIEAR